MRGDQPNYYLRKADSTNLDSRPGAKKAEQDDSRGCDRLPRPVYNSGVGDWASASIMACVEETREARIRFFPDYRPVGSAWSDGNKTYLNLPVVHRDFICPSCGQDMRVVQWCQPENRGRLVFDPETVVDANPNRPELA